MGNSDLECGAGTVLHRQYYTVLQQTLQKLWQGGQTLLGTGRQQSQLQTEPEEDMVNCASEVYLKTWVVEANPEANLWLGHSQRLILTTQRPSH